jgi:predicted DNA-binding protein (UPF0251 family)
VKNKKLKMAIFEKEMKYKEVAEEMGINRKVFMNKINQSVVNGYVAKFKPIEKVWLANRFGIKVSDIE